MADRQHIHGRLTTGKWQTSGREAAQKWLESSSQAAKKGRQWQGRAIATNVCNSAVSQAMGAADQYKVLNERSALPQKQAPEGPCRINSGGNQWSWLVSSRNGTIKTQSHPNPWEASAPSSGHAGLYKSSQWAPGEQIPDFSLTSCACLLACGKSEPLPCWF
eukprot:scaffold536_cov18-Tisochrysis_lutea.AAC.1